MDEWIFKIIYTIIIYIYKYECPYMMEYYAAIRKVNKSYHLQLNTNESQRPYAKISLRKMNAV